MSISVGVSSRLLTLIDQLGMELGLVCGGRRIYDANVGASGEKSGAVSCRHW